jgi:hydroxyacylglutathione hydrolase/adenylyltransferase/sulfurtransferase
MDGDLTPRELADRLERGEDFQIVDVRQPEEWEAGRISGARHIELAALAQNAASVDRAKPVVFVCRSGSRSAMATEAFRAAGYDAHNMTGGQLEWEAAGLPLDPPDGHTL